jgi:hypothetical protein
MMARGSGSGSDDMRPWYDVGASQGVGVGVSRRALLRRGVVVGELKGVVAARQCQLASSLGYVLVAVAAEIRDEDGITTHGHDL